MLKRCLNPKVLIGLALIAIAVAVFAPKMFAAALPLLLLAACPLSMVAMMFMMRGKTDNRGATDDKPGTIKDRKEQ
ncbi:MAG: DUF2933 domain-containing protein [Candidatus Saccharimonadales bacterium]